MPIPPFLRPEGAGELDNLCRLVVYRITV